jgi:exosortase B
MAAHENTVKERPAAVGWLHGWDPAVAVTLSVGLLLLLVPLLVDWSRGTWELETQGHEPIIFAVSAWLVWRRRAELAILQGTAAPRAGAAWLVFALLLYLAGRIQGSFRLELVSMMLLPAALLLYFKGWPALRRVWFAFFFLIFAIPLPFTLVLAITGPMKTAVSVMATELLELFGYPMGRSGVVITIGQYQLLVNEACAGLQTMFTLEAMGLLYTNLMNHALPLRNTLLVVLVVPIALAANVIRVVTLTLVTYYLGNDAGQGFLHGFAGMLLFVTALALVVAADGLLGRLLPAAEPAR